MSRFLFSVAMVILLTLTASFLFLTSRLPDIDTLKESKLEIPLRIYTADKKLISQFGEIRRTSVKLEDVPKNLVNAVLATEDKRFYEHSGVDIIGLVRAARHLMVEGNRGQGGSTITMQVARNFYLTPQKTFIRKINEILLAFKIEQELSKDEILELYLNKIYLGNRAYGVVAAAEVYYGKTLNELTLAEAATIAGLPKAPSRINPLADPKGAKERRDYVLARMLEDNFIDQKAYDEAINTPVLATYHGPKIEVEAPYVAEMVRQALFAEFGEEIYTKGWVAYATVDSNMQVAANNALKTALVNYGKRHGYSKTNPQIDGALVALDPITGAIKALVGGFDFYKNNFNTVTQAQRQPGSSFKPFIYGAALEKGFTPASIINDAPLVMEDFSQEEEIWRPQNDNLKFYGPTRLRMGLVRSRNLVSIRLLNALGINNAIEYASRFGFDAKQMPHGLSLALGTNSATPLQMAAGFAAFANGGYKTTPYIVDHVVNEQGEVIFRSPISTACLSCTGLTPEEDKEQEITQAPRIISEQDAYIMVDMLKDVIKRGTGRGALKLNRSDIAGKTGTNGERDVWFSGFTGHLVATTWMGFDDNRDIGEYAAQTALPMWLDFMQVALQNQPEYSLPKPPGIVTLRIDPDTGLLVRNGQDGEVEIFNADNVPTQYADEASPADSDSALESLF